MKTHKTSTPKGNQMTKRYFDLLEELDSKLAYIVDELEQEKDNQTDDEDEEAVQDFIDELEAIRGIVNP